MKVQQTLARWRAASIIFLATACTEVVHAQTFSPPFQAATVVGDDQTRFESLLDYDADGKLDAVSVWIPTPSSLYVRGFRNVGGGRLVEDWIRLFGGLPNPPTPAPSAVLAAGDFDGDGRADFALTLNQIVGYWYSNGAGAAPNVNYVFGEPAIVDEMLAADFDGDGRTDLALREGLTVRIWMTQPAGPPVLASSTILGQSGTVHLFVTDANSDGLPDLGVIGYSGQNGTTGTAALFAMPNGVPLPWTTLTFSNVAGPMGVSGDVDNDGDVDVVAFSMPWNGNLANYQTARRTGSSAFNVEPQSIGGPATNLVDLDSDGDLDGACCSGGGGGPSYSPNVLPSKYELSINYGGGAFASALEIASVGATHLAGAADLDGDGDVDLVAGRCIYYGGLPPSASFWGVAGPRELADLDGDGDVDGKPGLVACQANVGDGTFHAVTPVAPAPAPGRTWWGPGFPGDFDGDGDVDLLVDEVTTFPTPSYGTHLLRNLGSGAYVDGGLAVPSGMSMLTLPGAGQGFNYTPMTPESSYVADLDGDGDQDIVVRSNFGANTTNSANSKVWWNQGSGTFLPGPDLLDVFVVHAGDFDGDGIVDLLAQRHQVAGYSNLVVLKGLGTTFIPPGPLLDNDTHMVNRPAAADFDGDGDLDVFSTGNNTAKRITNLGGGVFTAPLVFNAASPPSRTSNPYVVTPHLAFALDVDVDGLPDVVSSPLRDVPGGMAILLNPVLNSPNPAAASPILQVFQPIAFTDLDGDGDDDALGSTLAASNARFGPGAGRRIQYGTGLAGSGGIMPITGDRGPFRAGSACELRIRGGVGGAAAILIVGAPASSPLFGATLLVTPDTLYPIQLGGLPGVPGAGGATIPFVMPASLVGTSIFHQVGIADPTAPFGWSATNGVRMDVGP